MSSKQFSMANKRVLIFSLAYFPLVGGAEVAVKEITDRLPEVEFDMVTKRFNDSDKEFEKIGNVEVYRVSGPKHLYPFIAFLKARSLHERRRYTHTWAIMANWAGFAALFFKLINPTTKFVLTLQEGDPLEYIKRKVLLVYPLFKKIFIKADMVTSISTYLAKWAREMGHKREVVLIPNGVDLDKFENSGSGVKDEDKTILITTSRLVKKNGVEDIIEAMKSLPEDIFLQILGTGPLENRLRSKIKNLGLEDRVEMLGLVEPSKIPAYLHKAHIFVRPSLSEGMGNSFIEAMAAGLPVIATPVGGIPDFLFDPDKSPHKAPTGLYVAVHDPEGIARQVRRLIKDTRLKESLVANGRRLVREHYSWDLIAREMKGRVFSV